MDATIEQALHEARLEGAAAMSLACRHLVDRLKTREKRYIKSMLAGLSKRMARLDPELVLVGYSPRHEIGEQAKAIVCLHQADKIPV
jgi:hypothetical protein